MTGRFDDGCTARGGRLPLRDFVAFGRAMRYEQPAIEDRQVVAALLVTSISGGGGDFATQPVWRSSKTHYEAPAIEDRLVVKALAGRVISGGGGDQQPVWRSTEPGEEAPED
jgi:hypothetical protein